MDVTVTPDELRRQIEAKLPGARVRVELFHGSDHFQVSVEAPQFAGLSLVDQHRLVYAAVGDLLGGAVHALALRTRPLESHEVKP